MYKRNLRDYARNRANMLIIVYSKSDCETKDEGLLFDFIKEELDSEQMSWVNAKEVEFTEDNVVIFE